MRGDVALTLFQNSDLRTAKRRPVLVVQANDLRTGLPQVVEVDVALRHTLGLAPAGER